MSAPTTPTASPTHVLRGSVKCWRAPHGTRDDATEIVVAKRCGGHGTIGAPSFRAYTPLLEWLMACVCRDVRDALGKVDGRHIEGMPGL